MKRAIVLCGGGAIGAYEIGAWKALNELGVHFDIVTGSSIGALNGAFVVTGDFDQALKLWNEISPERVMVDGVNINVHTLQKYSRYVENSDSKHFWNWLGRALKFKGVDISPFKELCKKYIDPVKVKAADIDFGIVTCTWPNLKTVEIKVKTLPEELILPFLHASSACYPIFPKEVIGNIRYVDGGYKNNLPIDLAFDMGADEVVAIGLDSIPRTPQKIYYTKLPNVRYIYPKWPSGSIMDFSQSSIQKRMILGYNETMKSYGKYIGNQYTFKPTSEFDDVARELSSLAVKYNLNNLRRVTKKMERNIKPMMVSCMDVFIFAIEYFGEIAGLDPTKIYDMKDFIFEMDKYYKNAATNVDIVNEILVNHNKVAEGKMNIATFVLLVRTCLIRKTKDIDDILSLQTKHQHHILAVALYKSLYHHKLIK